MSYTVKEIARPDHYLNGEKRERPLPEGVTVKLLTQVGNNGYRKSGDHFIEYFYENDAARAAHVRQRQGL